MRDRGRTFEYLLRHKNAEQLTYSDIGFRRREFYEKKHPVMRRTMPIIIRVKSSSFLLPLLKIMDVMDVKLIFDFLKEITRCEYNPNASAPLAQFTYNDISYAQGRESYQMKLSEMFNEFKTCIFDVSLTKDVAVSAILTELTKAQSEAYYDIPDEDYIHAMEKDAENNDSQSLRQSIREAYFLNEMVNLQRWYVQEAIIFLQELSGDKKAARQKSMSIQSKPIEELTPPLQKRLEDYGEFLSVKEMTEIFSCTPRTLTNWERDGHIINVAPKSEETTANGRKKRGLEKRYKKESIIRSTFLQEKFNEKNS